jgi:hypothetical protein
MSAVLVSLPPDALTALLAYANRRRADLTATRLGEARRVLSAFGLVRDCMFRDSPMYVAATDAGLEVLAEAMRPVQLELFGLAVPS